MLKLELELALKEYDAKHPEPCRSPKSNSKGERIFEHDNFRIYLLKEYLKHLSSDENKNGFVHLSDFYDFIERRFFKPNRKDHLVAREIFNEDYFNREGDDVAIFKRIRKGDEIIDGLKNTHQASIANMSSFFEKLSSLKIDISDETHDGEIPAPESSATLNKTS